VRQSSLISTEPWGFESEHTFVNAAILCETEQSPRQVLCATQKIEREMGRKHKSVDGHYADRVIDIDILLYDDLRVDEPDLQIPHPLMLKRDFVMIPLREIRD
jgi:2-amino-4-hydroxy-6-hydroxymethyldihydropteridine diphosphokinase